MTSLTFDIYLRSTPERVWAVLTDPGKVPAGRFGMSSHTGPPRHIQRQHASMLTCRRATFAGGPAFGCRVRS